MKNPDSRGALYVSVDVKVPTRLTKKEREALESLKDDDARSYRKDV